MKSEWESMTIEELFALRDLMQQLLSAKLKTKMKQSVPAISDLPVVPCSRPTSSAATTADKSSSAMIAAGRLSVIAAMRAAWLSVTAFSELASEPAIGVPLSIASETSSAICWCIG